LLIVYLALELLTRLGGHRERESTFMASLFDSGIPEVDSRAAGFRTRAIARVIDTVVALVLGVVAVIVAVVVLVVRGVPGPPEVWLQSMGGFSLVGIAVSFLGDVLYHSFSEYFGGASLGKLVCGLRVVSEDFGRVSFRGAAVRSAAIVVDGLFFGWVGYRSMQGSSLCQRFGDQWGRTAVVRIRAFGDAARGPGRVLLGLLLGLSAWLTIQVFWLVSNVARAA
jgi:uncharacterized RDD family membrane protein YckC